MIISSEIEDVEKSGKFGESVGKIQKSILRAFARTRAKNQFVREGPLPTLVTLLSVSVLVSVGTATAHSTVLPHNKMKKTREANERSSEELRKGLFSCLPVGVIQYLRGYNFYLF